MHTYKDLFQEFSLFITDKVYQDTKIIACNYLIS